MSEDWQRDLEVWLRPFLAALRHKTRQLVCPAYIAGLIGPGDRKSVQPMAARDAEFGYDQLHHFVADGVWDSAPLEAVLLQEADRLVGDEAGYLVIDDTAGLVTVLCRSPSHYAPASVHFDIPGRFLDIWTMNNWRLLGTRIR